VDWIGESSSEEEDEKEKHVRNLVHLVQHRGGGLFRVVLDWIREVCGLEESFLKAEKFEVRLEGEARRVRKSKPKTSSEGAPSFQFYHRYTFPGRRTL
jgi:hypothetical protein